MSCVKNVSSRYPEDWVPAATPLPLMMGMEHRGGKDKPVITKALTDLEGDNYKAYVACRDKWALYDCYRNIGPIQFDGPDHEYIPYLVKAPVIADLLRETEIVEEAEKSKFSTFVPYPTPCISELAA